MLLLQQLYLHARRRRYLVYGPAGVPPPGFPQAKGLQPETPRQVWHLPCLASQAVHSGVHCPADHLSAGQTAAAEHVPVGLPVSHQEPVRRPQSQQGRISKDVSPVLCASIRTKAGASEAAPVA